MFPPSHDPQQPHPHPRDRRFARHGSAMPLLGLLLAGLSLPVPGAAQTRTAPTSTGSGTSSTSSSSSTSSGGTTGSVPVDPALSGSSGVSNSTPYGPPGALPPDAPGGASGSQAQRPDPRQSSVTEFNGSGTRRATATRKRTDSESLEPAYGRSALQRIDLFHGQARLLPVRGSIRRIAIGNGAVVSATSVEDGILVLGEQRGVSSILVWTDGRVEEYLVSVSEQDIGVTSRYLQSLLQDVPGASVERIGERLVLRGSAYKPVLDRVTALASGVPGVVNLMREQEGFPKKKTIHFKVQIVELAKTVAQDLGILWDTSISGPRADFQGVGLHGGIYNRLPAPNDPADLFSPTRIPAQLGNSIGGAFIGIASSITSRINIALNNGDATLLAAPEVSTSSGGEARFLAGGQVPIVTSSFGGTTVEYKDYGIVLNIKPLVDADNNVSAAIETEVSQIDPSITFGGFPAFLTRKSRSDVSLRPYETLAISGLVNSNWARSVDKVPLLGDLPVLGRLFRSDNFQNKRTDLVIFVTPDVSDVDGDNNRALVQKARDIGNRVPAVETDPRYTPFTPPSTDVSPLPSRDSPPPPAPRAPEVPAPLPGGPGVPIPFSLGAPSRDPQ